MISKKGERILTENTWHRVAGPKSDNQWVDGRSAKESARFWLQTNNEFPKLFALPIEQHENFGTITSWSGEPEAKLKFDACGGETRNTDLLLTCEDSFGTFLIAVEAKADESFGSKVASARKQATEYRKVNERSRALERLNEKVDMLFGSEEVEHLQYQLLRATSGALRQAERSSIRRVILAVHEFKTDVTIDSNHKRYQTHLDLFLSSLSGGFIPALPADKLIGPVNFIGLDNFPTKPELYFLKVVTN